MASTGQLGLGMLGDDSAARVTWVLRLVAALVCLGGVVWQPGDGRAQGGIDELPSRSFITPFPEGDSYDVELIGDSWADGLIHSIRKLFADDARVRLRSKVRELKGLASRGSARTIRAIGNETSLSNIAIVMTGAYDYSSVRSAGGRRVRTRDVRAWRAAYSERAEALLKALLDGNVAVYWITQPVTRKSRRSEHAKLINEIISDLALRYRIRIIDIYDSFADDDGSYNDYGPDTSGKVRRLRWRDGLHFTGSGYEKIAYFVNREIKRDLKQAREERLVELLGDDIQQSRIRRPEAKRTPQRRGWSDVLLSPFSADTPDDADGGDVDVPSSFAAETSEVDVKVPGGGGETLAFKIERPAIAPTVLALVSQRALSDRRPPSGASVVLEGDDGVPLIGTVIPASRGAFDAARTRSAPTQTPIFKVWAKGERLPPRDNRADDVSWPRPQPVILVQQPQRDVAVRQAVIDPIAQFEQTPVAPPWDGPPIPERNPRAF